MVVEIPVVVRIKAAQRILDILNAGKILELQKLLMRGGQSLCCLKKLKRNLGRFSSVANSGNWVTAKNL